MKFHIKNMVCNRCVMAVTKVFEEAGHTPSAVNLGEVTLDKDISEKDLEQIRENLKTLGFEIINNQKSKLIEQIKTIIVDSIYGNEQVNINLSRLIEEKLNKDYGYLSNLFSSVEGITLEKYYIAQKIERVKELLVYGELTLSQIADTMGYSSVAHLSSQFKKVTGLTPSYFKELGAEKRKPLDQV